MNNCCEIIVTYNRKKLLLENINALINQTYTHHDILIVDNNSDDGTEQEIQKINDNRISYYNTGTNLGGAGGFSFGLNIAIHKGYKYAWIMDDDSIPDCTALESIIKKADYLGNNFSFLASLVFWVDGNLFDMNLPNYTCKSKHEANFIQIRDYRILPIQTCSFVGCFINLDIAKIVGLPISEFFIYGDDTEYTMRLRKQAPAYLDLESTIIHKAPSNQGADIVNADISRIERFLYQSRNGMYIAKKNKQIIKRIKRVLGRIVRIIRYSNDHKLLRIWTLIKGTIQGFWFNPQIKYASTRID